MTVSLASLLVQETKAAIYAAALQVATDLGLDTTSWRAGDPTRSTYHILSNVLESFESIIVLFIGSGFLDYATGAWLTLLAEQLFNVTRTEASFATVTDYLLTNSGGGEYTLDAGDLTVKNSVSGATYHNTTGGTLTSSGTLEVDLIADVAGSDGSSAVGEIDELVTTLLGVTGSNPNACVGVDEESDAELRVRCRNKVAALSPDGPADAYAYVALTPDLTGTSGPTRVRVFGESDTGVVTVYVADADGNVSSDDRDAVEEAILTWATPLCITPVVTSATGVNVPVTYTVRIYRSVNLTEAEVEDAIADALAELFATRPIGGDIPEGDTTGSLYVSNIIGAIRDVFPDDIFSVTVSAPAADVALANNEVAILSTITPTVLFADAP